MFYSFFACWRNRWPLLIFIGSAVGAGSLAIVALVTIVTLVVPTPAAGAVLIAPLTLALMAIVQGGIFRMYMQVVDTTPDDQVTAASV
jgi:hypothetical protein